MAALPRGKQATRHSNLPRLHQAGCCKTGRPTVPNPQVVLTAGPLQRSPSCLQVTSAKKTKLKHVNTALETASNPSALLLPPCISVVTMGDCGDKDAPFTARRPVWAPTGLADYLCRNYYSNSLLYMLAMTWQDYADLSHYTLTLLRQCNNQGPPKHFHTAS